MCKQQLNFCVYFFFVFVCGILENFWNWKQTIHNSQFILSWSVYLLFLFGFNFILCIIWLVCKVWNGIELIETETEVNWFFWIIIILLVKQSTKVSIENNQSLIVAKVLNSSTPKLNWIVLLFVYVFEILFSFFIHFFCFVFSLNRNCVLFKG